MTPRPQPAWAVAALLCAASLPPAAGAAPQHEQPQVQLVVDECVAAPRAEIERLCAIELGAEPLAPDALTPDATRLIVTCREGLIDLLVDDPVTGKTTQRLIDPGALPPDSLARLVALALAELVAASWAELAIHPAPKVPSVQATARPPARRAAVAAARRRLPEPAVRLGGLGMAAAQLSLRGDRAPLFGGGVRLSAAHRQHFGWAVDLLYHHSAEALPLGTVTTESFSASAALLYERHWQRQWQQQGQRPHGASSVGVLLGGGVRGGAVRILGEPAAGSGVQGATVWGPTAGIYASAGLDLTLGHLALHLSAEVGQVLLPVVGRVDGIEVAGVDGQWLGLRAGIGAAQ